MDQRLIDISGVLARLEPGRHDHETANRAAIDADWERRIMANPTLFNGDTVLGARWSVTDDGLEIACRKTDYATLIHWLSTPGANTDSGSLLGGEAVHFFANAVITGSDGKVVMGRMAGHTFNAGRVYMPSGSFDPDDFIGGVADFAGNMRREVAEETGVDLGEAEAGNWSAVVGKGRIAVFRPYRFEVPAEELAERARKWLATEGDGELADILTFAPGETHPDMPSHVALYMQTAGA